MLQTDGSQEVSIIRLFSKAPGEDWYYEDLYIEPNAVEAVSSLADEMGVTYKMFGPTTPATGCGYNDKLGGLKYLRRMAECSELGAPPEQELAAMPPPKVLLNG